VAAVAGFAGAEMFQHVLLDGEVQQQVHHEPAVPFPPGMGHPLQVGAELWPGARRRACGFGTWSTLPGCHV
jgi:hypothetical protein